MRKPKFVLKVALALAVLSLMLVPVVFAQNSDLYFPETGHNVRAPFVQFFINTGGAARYGYPITESYVDPGTGLLIQYFQNARLESWPGNPEPYKIQLGLLGDQLGKRQTALPVSDIPAASDPSCRYFAETGQAVCHRFLDYFGATGDIFQYGYPISGVALENGRMVQYFQRTRMEWWPENLSIRLAPLGQIYFDYAELDRGLLHPPPQTAINGTVTDLSLSASVTQAIIAQGGSQQIYVLVRDQLGRRISGAAVTLVAEFPSGPVPYTLPPTDTNGTTTFTFPAGNNAAGTTVQLRVIVDYAGMNRETRTSYMLWFF